MYTPRKYGIIGSGRLAKHLLHYFSLLGIQRNTWSRAANDQSELPNFITHSEIILLLIKDDAIEAFIKSNPELSTKTLVHCSGSLTTDQAIGVHPLLSFGENLYSLEDYKRIPFVTEAHVRTFQDLFPALENPSYGIDRQHKALYHALCVMSGNFTAILWSRFFDQLHAKFGLPPEVGHPYLESVCKNLKQNHKNALTGPLVRGDTETIAKNLAALGDDPFARVYEALVEAHSNLNNNSNQR